MRLAIIDLGTNSVRFDVHRIGPGKRIKQLHREKLMVRLGQGVFIKGRLNHSAIKRTLDAFSSFRKTAEKLRVQKILAFGTSALREAEDRDGFIKLIKAKVGIDIHIISGQEEANLIALGILTNEKSLPNGLFGLVDIGGGSTEISICKGDKVLFSDSFPLGTARLQQVFLKSSPPPAGAADQLRRYIKSIILPKIIADEWPRVETILGSSGTVRALARLIKKKIDSKSFERDALKKMIQKMSGMDTSELLNMEQMELRRVDMILGGAILAEECMNLLKAKKMKYSEFSMRDGVLKKETSLFKNNFKVHAPFYMPDLIEKAVRFGSEELRIKNSIEIVDALFDGTKNLHKLGKPWKNYLTSAMILRKTGESISTSNLGKNSSFIIKNMDVFTSEPWETDFVAKLVEHHALAKVELDELNPYKDKHLKSAFPKLLALLRIADALDTDPSSHTKIRKVRIQKHRVELVISGKGASELESLRVEQRQPLFVDVFKRQPVTLHR